MIFNMNMMNNHEPSTIKPEIANFLLFLLSMLWKRVIFSSLSIPLFIFIFEPYPILQYFLSLCFSLKYQFLMKQYCHHVYPHPRTNPYHQACLKDPSFKLWLLVNGYPPLLCHTFNIYFNCLSLCLFLKRMNLLSFMHISRFNQASLTMSSNIFNFFII